MIQPKAVISFAQYWSVWLGLWLLIMMVAALQGDVTGAFLEVTPSLVVMAVTVQLAFSINDRLNPRWQKLISLLLLMGLSASFNIWQNRNDQPFLVVTVQEFINAGLMMGVAFALRYGMNSIKAKNMTEKAELLRKLAEQRALNARLTPHVLYNMLNTIYSTSLKHPQKASGLILALAAMMRHLTDSTDKDYVDAQSELDFMRHYTELTRTKLQNEQSIILDFPGEVDCQIPNLLCVTLFENAITHGRSHSSTPEIKAMFAETDMGFRFSVTNSIAPNSPEPKPTAINSNRTHTGIDSVRERLAYLYPECHRFNAGPVTGDRFHAEIETW